MNLPPNRSSSSLIVLFVHAIFLLQALAPAAQAAEPPVILFTDLTSGPSTGNSDNSQPGQTAGQDGVIVTVWGKYLGTSPGQILVGGQQARIYSWANADHNAGPADLFTKHKMQMVSFQIPHTVPNGATTITAVVGGVTTNSLPFTVRAGNIYFVKNGGNDSAAGTWSNPWLSLPGALLQILPGDTVYPCDGVQQTAEAGDRAALDLEYGQAGRFSSQAMPKAIVAYPGAHVLIGNTAYGSSFSNYVGSGSGNFDDTAMYWTMSKLSLTANQNAAPLGSGFRLIGSYVTAPLGDQPTGGVSGFGNDLYILGNEVTGVGYYGTSKLYHPIYVQSTESSTPPRLPTESNREIGWNYLHDNYAYDGINIYRENTYSAFMTNHRVHDNYIINQPGAAMLIGEYITGENWFYNNIVIAAGSGPEPLNGDYPQHGCIRLEAGWIPVETGLPVPTTIHFYNNSIYNCGFPAAIGYPGTSGAILYNDGQQFTLDMRNNIVVAGPNAQPYVPVDSQALPSSGVSTNLWFGVGPAPSVDLAAVNQDPLFLSPSSGDLHLQTGSPAIDAGSSASPVPTVDFDNVPRPQNGKYDIGAYEYDFGNPPPAQMYAGNLDSATCQGISGWAAAKNYLNQSITVTILDGSTLIATITASLSRPDVGAALGDNGLHGFSYAWPSGLASGSHTIHVVFGGTQTDLTNSPQALTCGQSYTGHVDVTSCSGIAGWAASLNALNTPITVSLMLNGSQIASTTANLSRPDVGAALGDNGLHGFSLQIPSQYQNGSANTYQIVYGGTTTQVPGSPATLTCGSSGTPIYSGHVDVTSCSGIVGWVANLNALNSPITVSLMLNGSQIASTTANLSRPDVGAALGDNGLHGFSLQIPSQYQNGSANTYQIVYGGTTTQVPGSPATLTCGSNGTPLYSGHVDVTSCGGIVGWAANLNALNSPITVSLMLNGSQIASTTANLSRPDVGAALGDNGLHGFSLQIPSQYQNGSSNTYQVVYGATTTQVSGSPVTLACGSAVPNYTGHVDTLSCSSIAGWAANLNAPNLSLSVNIYDGPTLLTTVLANASRPDVGAALGDNGLHGFGVATPASILDGKPHAIAVIPIGSGAALPGSQSLTCP